MLQHFLELFDLSAPRLEADGIHGAGQVIPVRDGVAVVTPSPLPEGAPPLGWTLLDRPVRQRLYQERLMELTHWPVGAFAGKTVLECSDGAFSDALLALGARVVSVSSRYGEVMGAALKPSPERCVVQGALGQLPFRKHAFDMLFCHGVLHREPQARQALNHLLPFVKREGAVFVQAPGRGLTRLGWKRLLRPMTRRMPPEKLLHHIRNYTPLAFPLTTLLHKLPGGVRLARQLIPFVNPRAEAGYAQLGDTHAIAYGVQLSFDALHSPHDHPMPADVMRQIGHNWLRRPFEVVRHQGELYLRTLLEADQLATPQVRLVAA